MNATQLQRRERRGWRWLIFLLFFGLLALFALGQIAIRLSDRWAMLNANMQSSINPDSEFSNLPTSLPLAPLMPEIGTPLPWWDTFLTPASPLTPPVLPILTFLPPPALTSTLTQAASSPFPTASQQATSAPTATLTPLPFYTWTPVIYLSPLPPTRTFTPRPTNFPTSTLTPTRTITPTATITQTMAITPTATTATPTETDAPTAVPTAIPTAVPTAIPTEIPTAIPTEIPTAIPIATATIAPPPGNINIGSGDGVIHILPNGGSLIIDMGANLIIGDGANTPDMVYYEMAAAGGIYMDCITVEISENYGGPWFVVFDWCDSVIVGVDANTSLGGLLGGPVYSPETDNLYINPGDLYGAPPTGVMIDIDSLGLTGIYRYARLSVPLTGADAGAEIDAIGLYP